MEAEDGAVDVTRLEGVLPENIPVMWGFVAHRVAEACDAVDGADKPYHYYNECCAKRMQLWMCLRDGRLAGVLITSITGRTCRLEIAQADCLEHAMSNLGTITAWAKSNGCNELDWIGRPGWRDQFAGLGFKTKTIHMSRAI